MDVFVPVMQRDRLGESGVEDRARLLLRQRQRGADAGEKCPRRHPCRSCRDVPIAPGAEVWLTSLDHRTHMSSPEWHPTSWTRE